MMMQYMTKIRFWVYVTKDGGDPITKTIIINYNLTLCNESRNVKK